MADEKTTQLEQVIQKHKNLSRTKIQVEAEIKTLEDEYSRLFNEAKENYGINTLDDLRKLFISKSEENKKAIGVFSESISQIEEKVQAINKGI